MAKKIILILIVLVCSGCTKVTTSSMNIENAILMSTNQDNDLYNQYEVGYRYYLPRNFNILESRRNNFVFINEGYKYYFYVDLLAYYNKVDNKLKNNDNSYYFKEFNYLDKYGYINISQKDDYFLIKMLYNYGIIEVKVLEEDIIDAVLYSGILLSSIDYNDSIISNLVGTDKLSNNDKLFELEGPKEITDNRTYLDFIEKYDQYENKEIEIKDPDVIN